MHQRDPRIGNGVFHELQPALLLLSEFDHLHGEKRISHYAGKVRAIYGELIEKGAHNINLVTPTPYTEAILESLSEPLRSPSSITAAVMNRQRPSID